MHTENEIYVDKHSQENNCVPYPTKMFYLSSGTFIHIFPGLEYFFFSLKEWYKAISLKWYKAIFSNTSPQAKNEKQKKAEKKKQKNLSLALQVFILFYKRIV